MIRLWLIWRERSVVLKRDSKSSVKSLRCATFPTFAYKSVHFIINPCLVNDSFSSVHNWLSSSDSFSVGDFFFCRRGWWSLPWSILQMDLNFAVTYRASVDVGTTESLQKVQRIVGGAARGQIKVRRPGVYTFVFDNTYSLWVFPSSQRVSKSSRIPSAMLTLHSTKLCTKSKILRKIFFSRTKVAFEALLSDAQNLKVTRLQGGIQTKLWTCWRNFDFSRSFERFLGLIHGFVVLQ